MTTVLSPTPCRRSGTASPRLPTEPGVDPNAGLQVLPGRLPDPGPTPRDDGSLYKGNLQLIWKGRN